MIQHTLLSLLAELPGWLLRLVFSLTVIWLAAIVAVLLLRRFSAAWRHRVWALSVVASLAVPILIAFSPGIPLGWLNAATPPTVSLSPLPTQPPRMSPIDFDAGDRAPQRRPAGNSEHVDLRPGNAPVSKGSPTKAAASIASDAVPNRTTQSARVIAEGGRGATWLLILFVPAAFGLVRLARSAGAARRMAAESKSIGAAAARGPLDEVCQRLNWNRPVGLKQTARTNVPLCVGWRQPCIVLPDDWHSWNALTLRAVLAHEVSHIVRRDLAWQNVASSTCALYWFHPLAWLSARQMRREREAACDDRVLVLLGRPADYARILLGFADQMGAGCRVPNGALALGGRSGFETRIRAVLDGDRRRAAVGRATGRLFAVAAVIVAIAAGALNPLASRPARLSAAEGDPPRKTETQNRFRRSPTAQRLRISQSRNSPAGWS